MKKRRTTQIDSIGERLEELGYKSYKEYLKSKHWIKFRKDFLKWYVGLNGKLFCEFCKSEKKLNVHHRSYRSLGHEKKCEMVLLCEDCHYKVHNHPKKNKLNLWRITTLTGRIIRKQWNSRKGHSP